MLLLFTSVFFVLQDRMISVRDVENLEVMSQLGNLVSNEVALAAKVGEGYQREFYIPVTLNGEYYNITVQQGWDLVVSYEHLRYIAFLEVPVAGVLSKGRNVIRVEGGVVFLNS